MYNSLLKKQSCQLLYQEPSKNAPLFIHDGDSYIIDRRTDKKILWKCEYSRKFKCRGRLHTDLNNILIKTVGNHENHISDPRSGLIRVYYDRLRQESLKNQTNPHNFTQANIGVQDEVRVRLTSNNNLKRFVHRWRQETSTASIPLNINFTAIPDKYYRTTRDSIFLRRDTGPTSDRINVFY